MTVSTSASQPVTTQFLSDRYEQVRQLSEQICQPLATEDYVVQSMPEVGPPKWHLGHTSWYFENFLLVPHLPGYDVFHPKFAYLFNPHYDSVGEHILAFQRGLMSRPTVDEVYGYRAYIDEAVRSLIIEQGDDPNLRDLILLLINHEQQHQEMLLADIKHIFAINPLRPIYKSIDKSTATIPSPENSTTSTRTGKWLEYPGGKYTIGYGGEKFAFDNEKPSHCVHLQDYSLACAPVTNGEYLAFIEAGGYHQPEHWLLEGWMLIRAEQWQAPLYWEKIDGRWWVTTLSGLRPVDENEPVCHVSFFEADAYARWALKRLPTEAEWEIAGAPLAVEGNFLESGRLHPTPASGTTELTQLFGDVWEWTQSAHLPYPGFKTYPGAIGEYSRKFMCNSKVLRGGSCATPMDHMRSTYRYYFPPNARWLFSGFRLAD